MIDFVTGLQPKHYTLLSGFVMALGVQLSGLDHGWRDALTPSFVGATVMQFAILLGALGMDAPKS